MNKFERGIDPKHAMQIGVVIPIINHIKELCVELCGDDNDYTKKFVNNNLDSLDFIELVMFIEKEYGIECGDQIEDLFYDYSMNEIFNQIALYILSCRNENIT